MVFSKKIDIKGSPERSLKEKAKKGRSISPGHPKSPGRPRNPGRPRSPGRPKSPSRLKREASTDKSPSRRKDTDLNKSPKKNPERSGMLTPAKRSPLRRSPSRSVKIISDDKDRIKESAIPVLRKKQKVIETDAESDTADEKVEVKEKPKAEVRGRTRSDITEKGQGDFKKESSVDSTSSLLKRVTRSQNREVERIVHLKQFDTITKKEAEFSDEDEIGILSNNIKSVSINRNFDYGSPIGVVFLIISLPILVFLLFISCNAKSCTFTKLPDDISKFTNMSTYFNLQAYFGFIGYILFLTLLTALPFGGQKVSSLPDKHEKFIYTMNGLFSAITIIFLVLAFEFKNIQVTELIIDHRFHLYIAAVLVGVLLSIIAYIRSFYVPVSALNPHIVDKSKIYNFFIGREIHPRIFGYIDLKMLTYRVLYISLFLADFAFVYHHLGVNIQLNTSEKINVPSFSLQATLFTYLLLHSIYIFDGFIFEHTWITSREFQQEGFGYRTSISCFMSPFISSFVIKYITEYNIQLAYWMLIVITVIFLLGYVLYRGSNNQKDAFRKNPYSPSFSYLETIPTTQGKKILSSGFWGFVRHPNYLGNILMELSLIPFVLCVPPVFFSYLNILLLIHRAQRDNEHCKQKYGAAWDRYSNRVKYILIPKVY